MINVCKGKYRKKVLFTGLLLIGLFMTSCQANDENDANAVEDSAMPQAPIEVTFFTSPDAGIQVGESVDLIAEVVQEGEVVEDADLVRFEIWHEDDEQSGDDVHNDHGEEGHHEAAEENAHDDHGSMADYETEHEMLEAAHDGNGQYVLTYTFEETGTYHIMYHVDARGFHAMTEHEIIVGE